jgi:hypothetical protein
MLRLFILNYSLFENGISEYKATGPGITSIRRQFVALI